MGRIQVKDGDFLDIIKCSLMQTCVRKGYYRTSPKKKLQPKTPGPSRSPESKSKLQNAKLTLADDKVTVLESEKRAWENSPEAQAIRDALNPWKDRDAEARKES
ncbi:hypothetical protein GBA52_004337 [Prunus armeniaca]|nr:hypothetical protein GBA52_004337 [Prunus armeniaca]